MNQVINILVVCSVVLAATLALAQNTASTTAATTTETTTAATTTETTTAATTTAATTTETTTAATTTETTTAATTTETTTAATTTETTTAATTTETTTTVMTTTIETTTLTTAMPITTTATTAMPTTAMPNTTTAATNTTTAAMNTTTAATNTTSVATTMTPNTTSVATTMVTSTTATPTATLATTTMVPQVKVSGCDAVITEGSGQQQTATLAYTASNDAMVNIDNVTTQWIFSPCGLAAAPKACGTQAGAMGYYIMVMSPQCIIYDVVVNNISLSSNGEQNVWTATYSSSSQNGLTLNVRDQCAVGGAASGISFDMTTGTLVVVSSSVCPGYAPSAPKKGLSVGATVGIVIGALAILVIIVVVYRWKSTRPEEGDYSRM